MTRHMHTPQAMTEVRSLPSDVCMKIRAFFSHDARTLYSMLTVLLVSISVAIPSVVHADRKIFPATICQIWGEYPHFSAYLGYSQFGRVVNHHPTMRIGVVCPIMRDNTEKALNYVNIHIADAYIGSGIDQNGVLRCELHSNGQFDAVLGIIGADTDGHSLDDIVNGYYSAKWWFYPDDGDVNNDSNYTLFCLIPPALNGVYSYINSIIIQED
jgi:hypothetical protein